MCSYNMLNGKPTCGNANLTAVLKEDFGFTGYITSDTDACGDIYTSHKYEPTGEKATRDCLMSGTDIDSGGTYSRYLKSAVENKVVDESYVKQARTTPDAGPTLISNPIRVRVRVTLTSNPTPFGSQALRNTYRMRFEMGLFDPEVF